MLSLPCVLGRDGVSRILEPDMSEDEPPPFSAATTK